MLTATEIKEDKLENYASVKKVETVARFNTFVSAQIKDTDAARSTSVWAEGQNNWNLNAIRKVKNVAEQATQPNGFLIEWDAADAAETISDNKWVQIDSPVEFDASLPVANKISDEKASFILVD